MEQNNPAIAIINGETVTFKDEATLRKYIENEIDYWNWLSDNQNPHRNTTSEIYNIFFFSKLRPLLDRFDPRNSKYNEFTLGDINNPYIDRMSTVGLLVQKTREYYGNLVAALLLVYVNEQNRKTAYANGNIRSFTENQSFAYERTVAIQIALSNEDLSGLIGETRVEKYDDLLEKFSATTNLTLEEINKKEASFESHIRELKSEINSNASAIQRSFKRRNRVYRRYARNSKEEANKSVTDALQRLASAKEAYDDQIDLDASVQYWIERKETHSTFKILWFFAVVTCMLITFASMLTYYSYGGAAGVSKYIHVQTNEPVQPQQPQVTPQTANSPTLNAQATPQATQPLLLGHTSSDLSLAIADLAGAALLITLLAVLIRIALRQFNTHSHFALDAAERITFTKTYLALLNEGKLKSDEDRRLILESLFRPSQQGGVVETPFSSPIELILKTLTEKKASV